MTNMQLFQRTMPHFYKFICIHLQPKRNTHSQIARCAPSIIRSFMSTTLTPSICTTIQEMGFEGILRLAAKSLNNRDFLSWAVGRVMRSRRQGKLLYDVKAQVTTLENSAFVRVSNGYYWRTKGEKKI
jgi:hypothetical protein